MNLRAAITLAARVATSNQALPILATVRIAKGHIIATDMVQQIDIPVELPAGLAGADVCLHAARLQHILKALPDDLAIDMALVGIGAKRHVTLTAGATTYRLNTLDAADFPTIGDSGAEQTHLTIEAKPFVKALKFVEPAMGFNDVRYYLNGCHIAIASARITFAAADGHRAHRARAAIAPDIKRKPIEGIVGNETVARILELAAQHAELEITLYATQITIHGAGECLTIKLIDGKFPDLDRVIPAQRPATAGVPRAAFAAAIGRVLQIFTAAKDKFQGLTLAFGTEAITISATNREQETATERFEWNAAGVKIPDALTIGMQGQYLVEALAAFDGERIILHLPDNADDCLYLTDDIDGTRQAVIMPARI